MPVSRRRLLSTGLAGAAGLALDPRALVERALAAAPAGRGRLRDIEHIVILVQENRSFDQYFGTYRGVRGFGDTRGRFAQPGYSAAGHGGVILPFHLDTRNNGECTNDIVHDWGPMHRFRDGGRMDGFFREQAKLVGQDRAAITMGYYDRSDVPFYHALADAFCLCDHYHCSVLGPTDPNQCYLISAWLGQDGKGGGPVVETFGSDRPQRFGTLSWTTMPDRLQAHGVSWKVYSADNTTVEEDPPFPLFKQFQTDPALRERALTPTYPADFMADVESGALPQVSWVYESIVNSEHPPAPVSWGEHSAAQIVAALTSNSELWSKTALLITWDENGAFFDHVPPPTPPRGTKGEYVSAAGLPSAAEGIRGPIGLGFRVPMLVVSPFSRGGFVCSDTFDHTSTLRLMEARFGIEVPNLSRWRRDTVGDLTAAFNFARPDRSVPELPATSYPDDRVVTSDCTAQPITLFDSFGFVLPAYPVPPNKRPKQEKGKARRPSGRVGDDRPLRVVVTGARRGRCAGPLRVRVLHEAGLRSVTVTLDGRTVRRTRRARFSVALGRRGRHTLVIVARDVRGRRVVARLRLRAC